MDQFCWWLPRDDSHLSRNGMSVYYLWLEDIALCLLCPQLRRSFRVMCPCIHPFVNLFDACLILWTVHTRVLKFHIWIPHGKIADLFFFSCLSYLPFWSYAPLKKSEWHLVSKRSQKVFELGGLKLGQLIADDEWITWLTFERIPSHYGPLKIGYFKLVSKISRELCELEAWNLVSW